MGKAQEREERKFKIAYDLGHNAAIDKVLERLPYFKLIAEGALDAEDYAVIRYELFQQMEKEIKELKREEWHEQSISAKGF